MNIAEEQDCDLIADALEQTANSAVAEAAASAAGAAFYDAEGPVHSRLLALLVGYVDDIDRPLHLRVRMLSAIGDSDAPEATAHLLRALDRPELEIQIQAALGLARGTVWKPTANSWNAWWPPGRMTPPTWPRR